MFKNVLKYLLLVLFVLNYVAALENGLARTPPMGWMHWERFRCITDCEKYPNECISEQLFKRTSDMLVSEGYADAGYEYVIIDDCWLEKDRDNVTQKLVPDAIRFPSGLNALADYIHQKGLKFGLYQDYGTNTCAGYPGVINHMALDAKTFADWDVDYVKLDGCYANINDMDQGYPEFGRLLNKTGRSMVYSCSWPVYQEYEGKLPNYEALKEHCNLWRNWDDIDDSFESVAHIMDYFSKNQDRIQPHAGPGHWNDPDMLILGNYGLSYDQSKLQMAIWSILAAPLIMSNDLAAVRPEIKAILQNRDIIAVDQDPLGIQGRRVTLRNNIEVWTRPITPVSTSGEYSYAVAFVSRRTDGAPYTTKFILQEIGLRNIRGYSAVDLFDSKIRLGKFKSISTFETRVNPNGVTFFKFTAL
ncbi:alpha-N-acetylgalactosaminidase-like [Teleopsis dalmanni]|uniref:alpha-N-acetylgalactosaminidase-like n=1 Tax=Teleopsis dalmanni TaxID=139649 RepID=UPI0018CEACB0|nr:alpha-N-acetylgalactosaminidase-like [Teleopsis dalmanni]XP_037952351.1 alpha-N-acetylgalactosaminidase-like [Teleopsis dalmanni]